MNSGASVLPASSTASRSCTSAIENVSPSMPTSRNAWARSATCSGVPAVVPAIRLLRQARRAHRVELGAHAVLRLGDRDLDHRRLGDLRRVAADGVAVAAEDAEQVLRALGVAEQVAAVRVLGDHPQRLALAAAADEDRDVAAQRLGVVVGAADRVVVARHRRALLGEHRARDPQVVLQPLEALLQRRERIPVRLVLGLEPARADAVDRAAARDDVERRGDLGVLRGVAVPDAADEQAERDRVGAGREAGEHRVALEHPVLGRADRRDLVVVVHQRQRREAGALRRPGDVDELVEDRLRPDAGVVEVRQVQVQLDRRSHRDHATPAPIRARRARAAAAR